ncbi:hypothetical protein BDA96_04G299500 [Sorghum bicolor]|uniref:Scarecrow-like protein 8 n=1 Tax=Sorghum bicolor TaxID=4558 RepID=A0A921UJS0_SORBI|nr:hypothetical protein BDA96_04G299500 [Sorghum bicolor]
MDPAGAPWCDPRRGYAYAYGAGSAAQAPALKRQPRPLLPPRQDVAAVASGGVLKRSHGEVERWQQALYLREVRQRVAAQSQIAHPPIDIGSVLAGAVVSRAPGSSRPPSSGFAGLSPQPSSTLSSLTTASHLETPPSHMLPLLQRQMVAAPSAPPQAVARVPAAGRSAARELVLLQELEKHLLGDDDDGEADATGSACGSTVTSSAWGDTIQELNSITAAPLASLPNNHNTAPAVSIRSPSNSSSSTASSAASSSPPTSTASSRQLLSEAAAAIADGNHAAGAAQLAVLKTAANPRGDAEQRLVAMMASALSSRIGRPPAPQHHLAGLCGAEQRAAWQLLHAVSPCFDLALHGANLAILDAVADQRVIHLIDFDVSIAQHLALIEALSSRRVAGTCLKVTAVADPTSPFTPALAQALPATEQRLKRHAQQAGLEFRFKAVSCVAGEIEASRLGCEPGGGEALVVNLAFVLSRVPDESVSPANPRDELLRGVRALCPRVVTLVEQELNANTAPLAARFADACAHYGAVLESLDATLARDSAQRARGEAALANKAANAVAREGPDRVERCEVFGKWRARFGMAGLRPVAIGQGIADRVKARLRPGFDVKLDSGRLGVGWKGRVVTVASAWR